MNTKTKTLLAVWLESRTRFSALLESLSVCDLTKKLGNSPNTIGFLIRHVGDVELLFAKNVFGNSSLKVSAKTVITKKDTGEWTNLSDLLSYVADSFVQLKSIIEQQSETDWDTTITTQEFGSRTKTEALARIASHNAYHAGQIAVILKYGIN